MLLKVCFARQQIKKCGKGGMYILTGTEIILPEAGIKPWQIMYEKWWCYWWKETMLISVITCGLLCCMLSIYFCYLLISNSLLKEISLCTIKYYRRWRKSQLTCPFSGPLTCSYRHLSKAFTLVNKNRLVQLEESVVLATVVPIVCCNRGQL